MRKNKAQELKVIRNNSRQHMTRMSRKYTKRQIRETVESWLLFVKRLPNRLRAFLNGYDRKRYVALSSGSLHGTLQMSRQ